MTLPLIVPATYLGEHSGELLRAVCEGNEFVIERYGHPVAKIVPVQDVIRLEPRPIDPLSPPRSPL